MTTDKFRVGVIGANASRGWASRSHLPALQLLPEFDLVAVCTTNIASAQLSAKKFGARKAYDDYNKMLQDSDIDVVAVSVKVPQHYEITMAALNAGKHTYTEWPLGANLEEAQKMTDLAHEKKLKTMVGLQERLTPTYLRLKELIDEDYIGEVLTCNMSWYQSGVLSMEPTSWWRADKAAGANVFTVGFGHLIDALCMILGEFTEVSAVVETTVKEWEDSVSGSTKNVTAPDNIVVFGRLEAGSTISAHVASVPLHASGYRVEIYGRTGSLFLDASETSSLGTLKLMGAKREDTKPAEIKIPNRLTWSHEVAHIDSAFPIAQMWRRFALVLRDEKSDVPDFETGLNRHRLMNSVETASKTGQKQIL